MKLILLGAHSIAIIQVRIRHHRKMLCEAQVLSLYCRRRTSKEESRESCLLRETVAKQPGRSSDVSDVQRHRPCSPKRQRHRNMSSASLSFSSVESTTHTPGNWGTSAGRSHLKNNLAMAWEKHLCSKRHTTSSGTMEREKLGKAQGPSCVYNTGSW